MMCRRITPEGDINEITDLNWRKKIEQEQLYRGEKGYILSRRRSHLPPGVSIEYQVYPGDDLTGFVDETSGTALHVCTRQMAEQLGKNGWDGVIKVGEAYGMKYIRVSKDEVGTVRNQIREYLKDK